MLGVVAEPDDDPGRRGHQEGRRADGRGRHLPPGAGRRLLRRRAGDRERRRPVLRRRGPAPPRLHRVRRVHDGLPRTARRTCSPRTTSTWPRRPARGDAARDHGRPADHGPGAAAGTTVEIVRTGAFGAEPARRSPPSRWSSPPARYGTQKLLHRMKATGALPRLSDRLGELTRTNSEAIVGADGPPQRAHRARLHPGRGDHLVVPPGRAHPHRARPLRPRLERDGHLRRSVDGDGGGAARPAGLKFLGEAVRHPCDIAALLSDVRRWSERTIIALVMQTRDNSITRAPQEGPFGRDVLRARRATVSRTRRGSRGRTRRRG